MLLLLAFFSYWCIASHFYTQAQWCKSLWFLSVTASSPCYFYLLWISLDFLPQKWLSLCWTPCFAFTTYKKHSDWNSSITTELGYLIQISSYWSSRQWTFLHIGNCICYHLSLDCHPKGGFSRMCIAMLLFYCNNNLTYEWKKNSFDFSSIGL